MENDSQQVLRLNDLFHISNWQHTLPWKPFRDGVDIYRLYGDQGSGPSAVLLRYQPGANVGLHEHSGYEHILVLSGAQVDENGRSEAGTLIINPPGTEHSILTEGCCIVLAIYEKPVQFIESTTTLPQ